MKYLINAFWGFCMALADSVPGVSGGTIAFILGFYDKFINALNDVFYGDFKKKKSALWFLFKLGTGWIVGMALATLVLTSLFETKIYNVSSLFLGFIVFSIPENFKSSTLLDIWLALAATCSIEGTANVVDIFSNFSKLYVVCDINKTLFSFDFLNSSIAFSMFSSSSNNKPSIK